MRVAYALAGMLAVSGQMAQAEFDMVIENRCDLPVEIKDVIYGSGRMTCAIDGVHRGVNVDFALVPEQAALCRVRLEPDSPTVDFLLIVEDQPNSLSVRIGAAATAIKPAGNGLARVDRRDILVTCGN